MTILLDKPTIEQLELYYKITDGSFVTIVRTDDIERTFNFLAQFHGNDYEQAYIIGTNRPVPEKFKNVIKMTLEEL